MGWRLWIYPALACALALSAATALGSRPATSAERTAVLRAIADDYHGEFAPALSPAGQRCLALSVRISSVDPRYAVWSAPPRPDKRAVQSCQRYFSNGVIFLFRTAKQRWAPHGSGSDFPCSNKALPPSRVLKDLVGVPCFGTS